MLQRLTPLEEKMQTESTMPVTPAVAAVTDDAVNVTPAVDYSYDFGNLKWLGDAGGSSLRVRGAQGELLPVRYGVFLSVRRPSVCPLLEDDDVPSGAATHDDDELIDVVS